MREAASRLQQKIQKHLLDSEDGKVVDEEKRSNRANLDHTGDRIVSMEYQVKTLLETTSEVAILSALEHFKHFSLDVALFSTRRETRRALLLLKWMNRLLIFTLLASSICSDERNEKCPGLSQRCL